MLKNNLYSQEFSEYRESLLEEVESKVEKNILSTVRSKILPYLEKDIESLNSKLIIGKLMRVGE